MDGAPDDYRLAYQKHKDSVTMHREYSGASIVEVPNLPAKGIAPARIVNHDNQ